MTGPDGTRHSGAGRGGAGRRKICLRGRRAFSGSSRRRRVHSRLSMLRGSVRWERKRNIEGICGWQTFCWWKCLTPLHVDTCCGTACSRTFSFCCLLNRTEKALKLKNSKEQADSEIAAYRSARETEYQRKLAQRSGDVGANADKLNSETRAKVDAIKVGVEQLKGEVCGHIIARHTRVLSCIRGPYPCTSHKHRCPMFFRLASSQFSMWNLTFCFAGFVASRTCILAVRHHARELDGVHHLRLWIP